VEATVEEPPELLLEELPDFAVVVPELLEELPDLAVVVPELLEELAEVTEEALALLAAAVRGSPACSTHLAPIQPYQPPKVGTVES
jgi:hypothetical protein